MYKNTLTIYLEHIAMKEKLDEILKHCQGIIDSKMIPYTELEAEMQFGMEHVADDIIRIIKRGVD